tara:strand:- start:17633 stop:19084 length:1452 start_codon:yes stop_codon:yes gene_type:complete
MRTLTALEKWAYAIGNMPYSVKDAAFNNFVVFYYTQIAGLPGSLAGLAMFIAISWDAISDPVVGSWSDSVRSRWGRRHPPILLGGLPFAALFLALFAPPQMLGESGLFLWLLLVSVLLRTFLTIYFIPYSAMGAELSADYDERTVIAKARVTMGWLAGMSMPAIGFLFIFNTDGDTDGRLLADNYTAYGVLSALVAAAGILLCTWGTRTVIERLPRAAKDAAGFSFRGTLADFQSAFRNNNFRISVGTSLAFGMAAGVYSTLSMYLATYYWEFSTAQLAGLVVPTALGMVLAFAVVGRLGSRYDKPVLMCAASLGIALSAFWLIGLRQFGLLPENGHALIYALQWLNTIVGVFSIVSLQILFVSLLADILDEHERDTGRRQEGVFFAASAFVNKTTSGVGALVAGVVIQLAGIQTGSQPGEVPGDSLTALGWFTITIITALALIAFGFARHIRLSRADHRLLQAELAERAGHTAAPGDDQPAG